MRLWSVGSIIHMIRLTRLFNSPGSRLLNSIRGRRRLLPSANCAFLPLFANPNRSFPFSNHFSRIPSSSFPISPVMDPSSPATASVSEAAPNPNRYTDSGPPEGIDFALATGDSQCSTELGADRKRVVPEEIAKGVVYLECESSAEGGSCDVYLVGTAHVSQESCKEVQAVISYLKPQVVFLELCSSRVAILAPRNLEVPTVSEMIDMWKKKKVNTFGILYNWFLTKVASKLEVLPGSEFRVAYEEAQSYGAKVILGDRPVQITLRRTWGKMTLWHRAKFLYYILFQTIFLPNPEDLNKMLKEMDDVDMLTLVIQEMSKAFPTLMETLLHERDMYMSSHLLKVASNHSSVVAVVGKGHLSGIKKHWKQPVEVKHLLEVPFKDPRIFRMKTLAAAGIAVTGIVVASGLYFWGKK